MVGDIRPLLDDIEANACPRARDGRHRQSSKNDATTR